MTKVKNIQWLPTVEEHDYPAAESYLSLSTAQKKLQKY